MSLKSGEFPWCIVGTDTKGNNIVFECKRCGTKLEFDNTGMAVSRFLEISEAFCTLHKECKEV